MATIITTTTTTTHRADGGIVTMTTTESGQAAAAAAAAASSVAIGGTGATKADKTIYFVRHGQGYHNVAYEEGRKDESHALVISVCLPISPSPLMCGMFTFRLHTF